MTTKPVTLPQSPASAPRLTPLPDPIKPPDMVTQLPDMARANLILEEWFMDRPDVLVAGDGYLCRHAGHARRGLRPDCMVAFALTIPPAEIVESNGYTISEIGQPPDFVLEIGSGSTGVNDDTVKRARYASYGVGEYWRFDRTGGRFHNTALAGDRLLPSGEYDPLPITTMPDGIVRGYSPALDLELRWVAGRLRFWDPVTREYLPDLVEAKAQTAAERTAREQAEEQATAERTAREQAEEQATAERTAREQAEEQATAERTAGSRLRNKRPPSARPGAG